MNNKGLIRLRGCAGLSAQLLFANGINRFSHDEAHILMLLIKQFRIGPVTSPRSAVLARGRRPRANTTDRGPVTGPIRNYLINDNSIN